jgi:DNA (cytosine-5)-methyltransferase 1
MRRKKKHILKAVDFFCCAGGVTSGFRNAGIKVLGGIDIDSAYKETYEKNNKGSIFIQADVAQLEPIDLEKKLSIKQNMDDLIFVGCSPCQYYTNLQTDRTKSKESKMLLEEFQRFVKYFYPGYIFVENVPGLETKDQSPLAKFKNFLIEVGYTINDDVVNASNYNVPQSRRRYILVASRVAQKVVLPKGKNTVKTVADVIADLPPIPAGYKDDNDLMHWSSNLDPINLERLQHTTHNGGTRLAWKNNKKLQLKCYIGKDKTFTDVYGRMFWNHPAPTITTKFHSISNGRFGHPEQDRGLSLREGAILQSFPRSYKFYSNNNGVIARMIGNAVPPELAKSIGSKLINTHIHATIQNKSKSS